MPAPMMMASKSGIGVTPKPVFACFVGAKTIRSRATGQTPPRRVAGLQVCCRPPGPALLKSALLGAPSAPIVGRIARQAATETGEGSDGTGAAAQADLDRRQRPPALSGRHLARAVCATAPRRSRALLRGFAFRAVLVGDPLRRHFCGRTRPRQLFLEFRARRHPDHRPAEGAGDSELPADGPARPHRAATHGGPDRGALQSRQFRSR